MSRQIKLTIPMRIFAKPRPRQGKYGNFYTPRDEREDSLESYFWQFVKENQLKLFTSDLRVDCIYICRSEKRPCDKDNADKTIGDCGEGILWKNDRQIADGRTRFITSADEDKIKMTIRGIKTERSVK